MAGSTGVKGEEKLAAELKGNTLRVYWYVLKSAGSDVGVREVQRALGFSSPTLAVYHLEKLREMGLVRKKGGEYYLEREVKVGVLQQFLRVGAFLFPRYLFYAVMFSTLTLLFVARLLLIGVADSWAFGLIFGLLGALIFWYEAFRVWRQKP